MMSRFIASHREELIRRCSAKWAVRPLHRSAGVHSTSGIPVFIAQLQRTLEAEEQHHLTESLRISGGSGGEAEDVSEMGATAGQHGRELLAMGFSVDQVVHGYGDLCQAVTDLAFELDDRIAVSDFRTLNRCLDNAIASAVTAFSSQREASMAQTHALAVEQMEVLLHSLRNSLATASDAVVALELGNLPVSGSTGSILKNSLAALRAKLGEPPVQVATP